MAELVCLAIHLGFKSQRGSAVGLKRPDRNLVEVRSHLTLLAEAGMLDQSNQPFGFAFTFLNRMRPNSLAFLFTGPTWRPRAFAMSSALTFFLADPLNRRVSASVHGRVTSPSPSARARPGGG